MKTITRAIAVVLLLGFFDATPHHAWAMDDTQMLAIAIYCEAGSDKISDACRRACGDVVLNRIADKRFPNTMRGVLLHKGQYAHFTKHGLRWPARATKPGEQKAVQRAWRIARELLGEGPHSSLYGKGYVWQALFRQGRNIIKIDNTYFGK